MSREPEPVEIVVETDLNADDAWAAVTDWPAHAAGVPFTTMEVTRAAGAAEPGVGDQLRAVTRLGPLRVVDPMDVVHWQVPTSDLPGLAVLRKTGEQIVGGASVEVQRIGARSRVIWREDARLGPAIPSWIRRASAPGVGVTSRIVFGRALRRLLADAR